MIPPPPPLPKDEVHRRIAALRAGGKPFTIADVDPAIEAWRRRVHIPAWRWALLIVAAGVLFGTVLLGVIW